MISVLIHTWSFSGWPWAKSNNFSEWPTSRAADWFDFCIHLLLDHIKLMIYISVCMCCLIFIPLLSMQARWFSNILVGSVGDTLWLNLNGCKLLIPVLCKCNTNIILHQLKFIFVIILSQMHHDWIIVFQQVFCSEVEWDQWFWFMSLIQVWFFSLNNRANLSAVCK